ncbi:MAG: dUTP diphosphatase [Bacilli bacterium]|nr:dUTP diphosphatase [Bacilli bacterium]
MKVKEVNVKIKKINERATIPTYGSDFAAGADLYACIDDTITIKKNETVFVPTGLSMEIPEGMAGLIYARSGLACKKGLAPANKVGVVDSDYRGEIMVALHNHSKENYELQDGERIAQMIFTPYYKGVFKEEKLSDTKRGSGGFGSTGKK